MKMQAGEESAACNKGPQLELNCGCCSYLDYLHSPRLLTFKQSATLVFQTVAVTKVVTDPLIPIQAPPPPSRGQVCVCAHGTEE